MCEFKVYSGTREEQKLIAEDITSAKLKENSLVLTDVLGRNTKIDGALITEVDVKNGSLRLYNAPFIFELLKLFTSCEWRDQSALDQLESARKALKARGDEVINSLKSTEGGA